MSHITIFYNHVINECYDAITSYIKLNMVRAAERIRVAQGKYKKWGHTKWIG